MPINGKVDAETQFVSFISAEAFIITRIPVPESDFMVPAVAELPVSANLTMHRVTVLQGHVF